MYAVFLFALLWHALILFEGDQWSLTRKTLVDVKYILLKILFVFDQCNLRRKTLVEVKDILLRRESVPSLLPVSGPSWNMTLPGMGISPVIQSYLNKSNKISKERYFIICAVLLPRKKSEFICSYCFLLYTIFNTIIYITDQQLMSKHQWSMGKVYCFPVSILLCKWCEWCGWIADMRILEM